MEIIGIRAVNTFGDCVSDSELWAYGVKRHAVGRSKIDYVAVSESLEAHRGPINSLDLQSEKPLFDKMGHRPVRADVHWAKWRPNAAQMDMQIWSLPERKKHSRLQSWPLFAI